MQVFLLTRFYTGFHCSLFRISWLVCAVKFLSLQEKGNHVVEDPIEIIVPLKLLISVSIIVQCDKLCGHWCYHIFPVSCFTLQVCQKDRYDMTWVVKLVLRFCKMFCNGTEKYQFIQQLEEQFSAVYREKFAAAITSRPWFCEFLFVTRDSKQSSWTLVFEYTKWPYVENCPLSKIIL